MDPWSRTWWLNFLKPNHLSVESFVFLKNILCVYPAPHVKLILKWSRFNVEFQNSSKHASQFFNGEDYPKWYHVLIQIPTSNSDSTVWTQVAWVACCFRILESPKRKDGFEKTIIVNKKTPYKVGFSKGLIYLY